MFLFTLFTVKQNYLHDFMNPNIYVGRRLFTLAGNNLMNMQEDCIQWGIAASNLLRVNI